jgi:hypothetical protein
MLFNKKKKIQFSYKTLQEWNKKMFFHQENLLIRKILSFYKSQARKEKYQKGKYQ